MAVGVEMDVSHVGRLYQGIVATERLLTLVDKGVVLA